VTLYAEDTVQPLFLGLLCTQIHKSVLFFHKGKVLAILAAADNAVPLFSGVLYTQVYNATISFAPATIFWVTFASQICVFSLIL
jgi:PCFT/HCP family folate transporter-like MFS transporter 1/3